MGSSPFKNICLINSPVYLSYTYMKIRIRNVLDFIKYSEVDLEEKDIDINKPFNHIIPIIKEKLNTKTDRLKFLIVKSNEQIKISDYTKSLQSYNFTPDKDSIQVQYDNGLEINHRLGLTIGYIGPILILFYFLACYQGKKDDGKNINLHYIHILATIFIWIHYGKRILECIFLHPVGVEKLRVFTTEFLGFVFYYWVLFGVLVGYVLFESNYFNKNNSPNIINVVLFSILFLVSEYNNFKSHYILKEIKEKNSGQRGIPYGGMFEYVSCAHYFWELMSWTAFSLLTGLCTAWLFTLFSLISMGSIANKKHKIYINYFGDSYPKNRKAFIPFIF
jgi:very-long-chain enoyl-CoA reductase